MRTTASLLAGLVLVGGGSGATAQTSADIVWSTNAHFAPVTSVSFSGDSARLASGSYDRHAKIWSILERSLVRDVFSSGEFVLATALSSNSTFVSIGGDSGGIRVRRVSDGGLQWQNSPGGDMVFSVAFSPDDSQVVEARGDSGLLLLHNALTGTGAYLDGLSEIPDIYAALFSPDNTLVASCGADQTAKLWRVSDRTLLRTLIGHSNEVNSVDFSPDGTLLATASADGTARIWNVTNGMPVVVIDGGGVGKFSADGKLLYTLNDGLFKIWRVSNGTCAGSIINSGAIKFDIAKNGKYFAYGTASGAVVLARTPLIIDELSRSGNQTILKWQGGSGLYQLQSCPNFGDGSWQNVGSATTNIVVTNVNASTLFFRVQSLPNP